MIVVAAVAAGACLPISGRASQPTHFQVVSGTCEASSHTAEGPLGTDLTKRQSRFYCNSAVISFFDDYKGHVLIQFSQKESHHGPILGFAGKVDDNGIIMSVDHVYLAAAGPPTTASEGGCKFYFKDRHMSGIACGVRPDFNSAEKKVTKAQ